MPKRVTFPLLCEMGVHGGFVLSFTDFDPTVYPPGAWGLGGGVCSGCGENPCRRNGGRQSMNIKKEYQSQDPIKI